MSDNQLSSGSPQAVKKPSRFKKIIKNKYFIGLIIILAAFLIYWFFFRAAKAPTQYIITAVRKSTLVVTVSGSGQVSALNQVDINPEGSGKVMAVDVKVGDKVKAGQEIIKLDQRSNNLSLTQAQASLLSAQANYNKVANGTTAQDLKIAQLSVDQANQAYVQAQTDLAQTQQSIANSLAQAQKDLDDLQNASLLNGNNKRSQVLISSETQIASAHNSLDAISRVLNDSGAKNTLGVLNSFYLSATKDSYQLASDLVSQANTALAAAKVNPDDSHLNQTVAATLNLLNATLAAANNCYSLLQNTAISSTLPQSSLDSFKNSINSEVGSLNGNISSLQSAWQGLTDALTAARNTLTNAQLSAQQQITAAQAKITSSLQSLNSAKAQQAKSTAPATAADLQSARSQLVSAQAQLQSAQINYEKNIITSPIDGQVAAVNVNVGDQASSGTAVATVITPQKIAVIQFNEVDTAKLKVGQDVDLTFDALPDLKIKGKVSEINGVGTVAQGVVNYSVKIALAQDNAQILTGMTVSSIVTVESKPDVLLVPSQAVQTQGSRSYVQVLASYTRANNAKFGPVTSPSAPQRVTVTVGASNDTMTEITSGLNEGDSVVTQTITSATASAASASGAFRIPGVTGGGGFGGGGTRTGATGAADSASGTGR